MEIILQPTILWYPYYSSAFLYDFIIEVHRVMIVLHIRDLDIIFGAVQPQSFVIFFFHENRVIFYTNPALYFFFTDVTILAPHLKWGCFYLSM